MADQKHYVQTPQGHELTEAEAMQLGYQLFDAIAAEQAKQARPEPPPPDDGQDE